MISDKIHIFDIWKYTIKGSYVLHAFYAYLIQLTSSALSHLIIIINIIPDL